MSIRFTPDTLVDAVMRPVAMAAPNGWVYVEVAAPDFRFVMIMLLAVAAALSSLRRPWKSPPTWILLGFAAASFVPWMYTTGNGRYFMPVLLTAGPLVVALAYHLPVTKAFKLALATLAIAVQGVALMTNTPWRPWDSWELVRWREAPYFQLNLPAKELHPNTTYVTISAISYSLLAPLFPPSSHWINISSLPDASSESMEARRAQAFLQSAGTLKLLLPTASAAMDSNFQPDAAAVAEIDKILAGQRLALQKPAKCAFLHSSSLLEMNLVKTDDDAETKAENARRAGFWMCSIEYPVHIGPAPSGGEATETSPAARAESALQKLEAACPRFFTPGQVGTQAMKGGRARHYPSADMRVYVLDEGSVYYKYERAMNPHKIGTVDGLVNGSERPDCKIRGRSGLPWEREI